jgi:sugar phosphate isomerase/epimerase
MAAMARRRPIEPAPLCAGVWTWLEVHDVLHLASAAQPSRRLVGAVQADGSRAPEQIGSVSHEAHVMSAVPPLALGVCSWSLQVESIPELERLLGELEVEYTQIACGDPHHASWVEGDAMPAAARSSGLKLTGAMLGFPGEDYTTPETIRLSGGFGPAALRDERLERLAWAIERTRELGLLDLMLHAGFIPPPGDPDRRSFLDTLAKAGRMASDRSVTLAFETGQETADLLRQTLDELAAPNLKVNFDPANMLLYDMGDPIRAVEILAADIRSVHVKDAKRPRAAGQWGDEVPLGEGEVDIKRFIQTLKSVGYRGPLSVEREVGDQPSRIRDIRAGLKLLRDCVESA